MELRLIKRIIAEMNLKSGQKVIDNGTEENISSICRNEIALFSISNIRVPRPGHIY
jgi:hypothetical protein